MDDTTLDLECKYISGKPVIIDDVPIYPVTLDEIFDLGYTSYNRILNIICVDSLKDPSLSELQDEQIYTYIIETSLQYPDLMKKVLSFFMSICKSEVVFNNSTKSFIVNINENKTAEINNSNFLSIQKIIKQRNGIENIEEEIDNPDTDMARKLLEKSKKFKQKIKQMRENDDGGDRLTIVDLVSILASGLQLSIDQVMKYDLYQFNNQFNRLKIFKDYDVNIHALLAGAKSDDVKLTHWMSKTNKSSKSDDEE